ncbi:hypothetical protein Tco_1299307 [Tanacetum coccineum]
MSNRHQELASPEQTASSKDFSNPLMVDTLAIPEQTATGKEISNPFMVDISLDLSRLATTLNRLERSYQTGIYRLLDSGVSDEARETLFVAVGRGGISTLNLDFATTGVAPKLLDFVAAWEVYKAFFTLEFTDKAYRATHLS